MQLTGQVRRAALMVGSSELAHDLVHDVFVEMYRRWSTIDEPGPYVNRSVLNRCRDAGRARSRRIRLSDHLRPDLAVWDSEPIGDLLDGLPFNQRAVIVLQLYVGLSNVEIATYLRSQAQRVEVTDELDAIENDLFVLPQAHLEQRHRRLAPGLGIAAAVLLIGGLTAVAQRGGETVLGEAFGAAPDPVVDVTAVPPADLAPIPVTTDAPVEVLLPDGAVLNGVVSSCIAMPDPVVFECPIDAAFPEPLGTLNYSGYPSVIVDDTSHVSGGCRVTNSDATEYLCHIGSRAVEHQTVGAGYLGQYALREYAAG